MIIFHKGALYGKFGYAGGKLAGLSEIDRNLLKIMLLPMVSQYLPKVYQENWEFQLLLLGEEGSGSKVHF